MGKFFLSIIFGLFMMGLVGFYIHGLPGIVYLVGLVFFTICGMKLVGK